MIKRKTQKYARSLFKKKNECNCYLKKVLNLLFIKGSFLLKTKKGNVSRVKSICN